MDNLFEQFATISKAHAYDIVSKQRDELVEENKNLKSALNDLVTRVNKARSILQTTDGKEKGYWGVLDTSEATALLSRSPLPPSNEGQQGCEDDPDDLKILEESYKK